MRKLLLIVVAVLLFLPVGWANDTIAMVALDSILTMEQPQDSIAFVDSLPKPYILDDMPFVRVQQDTLIEALLRENIYGKTEQMEIDGFRVQIFSSNRQQTAKEEALVLEKKMTEALSVAVYVTYIAPFWKVRLGNFRTYGEANDFKAQLVTQFPELQGDTYIVRDKIQVRK
ncbi:MAG: SPOR domain-containing protein [Paludibacteraceae bacterium]